tara:strand:+ start:3933 stop:4445 length:513 start_codon:yes stop_codon:yes gene_type:complete
MHLKKAYYIIEIILVSDFCRVPPNMYLHGYLPVSDPSNKITTISIVFIVTLLCQLLTPLIDHHAFELYPNHPHLPHTADHTHNYELMHIHPQTGSINILSSDPLDSQPSIEFIPNSGVTTGFIGLTLIWKWIKLSYQSDINNPLLDYYYNPWDILLEVPALVKQRPPVAP